MNNQLGILSCDGKTQRLNNISMTHGFQKLLSICNCKSDFLQIKFVLLNWPTSKWPASCFSCSADLQNDFQRKF